MEQIQMMLEKEKQDLRLQLMKHKHQVEKLKSSHESEVAEWKSKLAKKKRALDKQKSLKEELEMKIARLEAEKLSVTTLLNEKSREYGIVLEKNEELDSKNARLRKEVLRLARERNDAESTAKDKNFQSNVKSHEIKVLKSQLNKKSKTKKAKIKNDSKLNPKKNYLKDLPASDGMTKVKSQSIMKTFKKPKATMFTRNSDSGISDIDEADYYDGVLEVDGENNVKDPTVQLPNIIGRSKQEVYQSLSDLHDIKQQNGNFIEEDFDRDDQIEDFEME